MFPIRPVPPSARRALMGLCASLGAWAAMSPALAQQEPAARASAAAPQLTASADGAYVLDARTHLAWSRCVEGMRWNGRTCTGSAELFTYSQAQALARDRWKTEGVRWRLPRVNELRRLVNRATQPPSLDAVLFPATPMEWHWTSTASVNTATVNPYAYGNVQRGGQGESGLTTQQGWAVDMETGEASGKMGRATRLPVRLVRPLPAETAAESATK
ncbi:MAG: DUF1566 domain-containing protein [Comamonadaceae bacterium]|nr:MAG: DUF1566 domain-containing protein [Comamonadaceae bacterium]